jgi:hypothetical protein
MRTLWAVLGFVAACGSDARTLVDDPHIIVDGYHSTSTDCRSSICVHNENTDLTVFQGATYLVHRTAESQVLGPNSSLRVSRSDDHGKTWNLLAILPAIDGRDLRDPCFYVVDGKLAIKALTRLAIFSTRDSGVDSITVGTVSPDAGQTWSPLTPMAPTTWSFWRIHQSPDGTYYAGAYEDGDKSIALFSSSDGTTWTQGARIYDHAEDTPLEPELVFMPSGKLLALFRLDGTDDEILGNAGRLRTKLCWSAPPYAAWDCSRELTTARLDGPVAFFHASRLLVIARKHLIEPQDRKRTALFELSGNFDGGDLTVTEHTELPSAGDTSYAGVASIDANRVLVTWYSSVIASDGPWARAIFEPSDIWQTTLDLSQL